jgi:hypothetical protein
LPPIAHKALAQFLYFARNVRAKRPQVRSKAGLGRDARDNVPKVSRAAAIALASAAIY